MHGKRAPFSKGLKTIMESGSLLTIPTVNTDVMSKQIT